MAPPNVQNTSQVTPQLTLGRGLDSFTGVKPETQAPEVPQVGTLMLSKSGEQPLNSEFSEIPSGTLTTGNVKDAKLEDLLPKEGQLQTGNKLHEALLGDTGKYMGDSVSFSKPKSDAPTPDAKPMSLSSLKDSAVSFFNKLPDEPPKELKDAAMPAAEREVQTTKPALVSPASASTSPANAGVPQESKGSGNLFSAIGDLLSSIIGGGKKGGGIIGFLNTLFGGGKASTLQAGAGQTPAASNLTPSQQAVAKNGGNPPEGAEKLQGAPDQAPQASAPHSQEQPPAAKTLNPSSGEGPAPTTKPATHAPQTSAVHKAQAKATPDSNNVAAQKELMHYAPEPEDKGASAAKPDAGQAKAAKPAATQAKATPEDYLTSVKYADDFRNSENIGVPKPQTPAAPAQVAENKGTPTTPDSTLPAGQPKPLPSRWT